MTSSASLPHTYSSRAEFATAADWNAYIVNLLDANLGFATGPVITTVKGALKVTGDCTPASADGSALGSTALEWGDLYLADGSVIYLGNDQDVTLTHIADKGLYLNKWLSIGKATFGNVYPDWSLIQLGGNGMITADTALGDGKAIGLHQNDYYNAGWKAISTDKSSRYEQYLGSHYFYVSNGSDNADAAIDFINPLTIQNDGDSDFTGNVSVLSDSNGFIAGSGSDMKISYNGTVGLLETDSVAPSDLQIHCGADKTVVLEESVWEDMQFEISSGRVGAANYPDWDTAFTANTGEYKFDIDDYIDLNAEEVPHGWKEGTAAKVHLHIALDGANSSGGNQYAKFTVYVAYADVNEEWAEASPLTAELTIANGSADLKHILLDMGDLTLTDNLVGTLLKVRVKRIEATTGTEYPNHVFVSQCGAHIEKVRIGSRTVTTA